MEPSFKYLLTLFIISLTITACNLETVKAGAGALESLYCSDLTAEGRNYILQELRKDYPHYPEHGYCGIKLDI